MLRVTPGPAGGEKDRARMRRRPFIGVLAGVLAAAAVIAAALIVAPVTSNAQVSGINVQFVPGFAGLSPREPGTVEIRSSNLTIGQADTVQIGLEFDPAEITVTAARCSGLYTGANAAALVSINGGTGAVFSCADKGLPPGGFLRRCGDL